MPLPTTLEDVLPTKWSQRIAISTLPVATVVASLPHFLSPLWPKSTGAEIVLLQCTVWLLTTLVGASAILVLLLHHIRELNTKIAAVSVKPAPTELDINIPLEIVMERALAIVARVERQNDAQLAKLFGMRKQEATLYLHELRDAKLDRKSVV